MEFHDNTEHGQKQTEGKEHKSEDGEVGTQNMIMKGSSNLNTPQHIYGDEGEGESPKCPQVSSASPLHNEKIRLGNPPAADGKVTVDFSAMSSITLPSVFSATKKNGSIFSRSSLYDLKGGGRLQKAGHLKVIEAILRSAGAILSLIAFSVMTSTSEKRIAAGSTFEVKFSDFQAYNYLVALNVLSFVYSSAQVAVIAQSSTSTSTSSIFSSPIKSGVCKYFCDQILAFLLFSASSSAATALELALHGLHNIWPPACSTWKLWFLCTKADAAVVISFVSSFTVMLCSIFSGFDLVHLLAV